MNILKFSLSLLQWHASVVNESWESPWGLRMANIQWPNAAPAITATAENHWKSLKIRWNHHLQPLKFTSGDHYHRSTIFKTTKSITINFLIWLDLEERKFKYERTTAQYATQPLRQTRTINKDSLDKQPASPNLSA